LPAGTEGLLIARALALGFSAPSTDPDSPNGYFNIGLKISTAASEHAEAA
jgi:hypothetical protein